MQFLRFHSSREVVHLNLLRHQSTKKNCCCQLNSLKIIIFSVNMHRYTSTHDSLPGAPPPLYHHMHSHQRHSNVPHHHRPHCLMPSERDTAMMDEAYALYGYHDMVRVDRPPPYAVAVRSSRQCPAAAAAASSTATSADTSARPPSGSGSSNR